MHKIPLFTSKPTGTEIEAIHEVLESGWWAMGSKVKQFEEEFAAYTGAKYAVATNSCTSALDIAVRVAPLGDTVTVSPFTFVASAQCILNANKKVQFVDIDPYSLCTSKADIQVLFAGNDVGEGLIYDMAHAGGLQHKGLISCYSFHAVKNLPTGDGGMLTTNDAEIYRRAKAISWCGIDKDTWSRSGSRYSWDYNIQEVGLKANMNDITAAIGIQQLKHLKSRNEYRASVASWYNKHLESSIRRPYPSSTNHMYVIRVPKRDRLYDAMADVGISAGVHYKPLYHYPIFPQTVLPNAEKAFKEVITLPMNLDVTEEDVKVIAAIVNHHVKTV